MNTQKQLTEFKKEVRKTRTFLSCLMVIWQSPSHDLLALLLQNLGSDGSDCINYDLAKELQECRDIIETLNQLKKRRERCPVTQYICEEIDLIYTGYIIMTDF